MSSLPILLKNGSLIKNRNRTLSSFPSLSTWLDDLFVDEFPSFASSGINTGVSLPKVNVKETDGAFEVELAVPGMNKSDFQINIDDNVLSISTEKKDSKEEKSDHYTRREFGYASFKRAFTLPDTVDESEIKASYNDGILGIKIPKKPESKPQEKRTIEIS